MTIIVFVGIADITKAILIDVHLIEVGYGWAVIITVPNAIAIRVDCNLAACAAARVAGPVLRRVAATSSKRERHCGEADQHVLFAFEQYHDVSPLIKILVCF